MTTTLLLSIVNALLIVSAVTAVICIPVWKIMEQKSFSPDYSTRTLRNRMFRRLYGSIIMTHIGFTYIKMGYLIFLNQLSGQKVIIFLIIILIFLRLVYLWIYAEKSTNSVQQRRNAMTWTVGTYLAFHIINAYFHSFSFFEKVGNNALFVYFLITAMGIGFSFVVISFFRDRKNLKRYH